MKLTTKLFGALAVVCILFTVALIVALAGAQGTANRFDTFLKKDQKLLNATSNLYAQGLQMGQALRNIVLEPGNPQAYKNLEVATGEFDKALALAKQLADGGTAQALDQVGQLQQQRLAAVQKILAVVRTDAAAAVDTLNREETPKWREIRGKLLEMIKAKDAEVSAIEQQIAQETRNRLLLTLTLAAIALGAAVGIAIWLTRSVMRQLGGEPGYAVAIASGIAAGDLTARIELDERNRNSLLFAMKTMQESLATLVSKVRAGTETIATASTQIAAGNQDLSSRTEEQASSLQETAASMEELTSTVSQNTEHARQANQLAKAASETAAMGGKAVAQVVETMHSISASANKIADITSVIDGIAFQTNILALNAAVEAARAGEQGRGFAVVASEVRTLAQRSAAAAKEIKTLIEDSVEKVGTGSRQVVDAGATMEKVVASVARVNDIVTEIAAASEEQSAGIQQVNQAVAQMDQVTQQNAALVEQAAAAAESMQHQAHELSVVVSAFNLNQVPLTSAGHIVSAPVLDSPVAAALLGRPATQSTVPRLPSR